MGMRAAIVVGATGLTGSSLVEQLCENDEYVSVTVIARRKPTFKHPKLEVKICDFDRLEEQDIAFAHELYCCLGTTIKKAGSRKVFEKVDFEYPLAIASLAKKRGIPHFLVITAMGAKESSPFYYNRVKGKLEHDLMELGLQQLSIALHGKQQPVTIYPSHELAILAFPETVEEDVSRETLFNWDKIKKADSLHEEDKVNRNVVIDREKYTIHDKVVDEEVRFRPYDKE